MYVIINYPFLSFLTTISPRQTFPDSIYPIRKPCSISASSGGTLDHVRTYAQFHHFCQRSNFDIVYVLAHELAPGKFRPTVTHSFIRLLAKKGLLHTCFTQNIDTLERAAGVPGENIVEAHGSFADQHCVDCGAPYPQEKIKQKIQDQEIPICERRGCGGFVKPDIVFFGEAVSLPLNCSTSFEKFVCLITFAFSSCPIHSFAECGIYRTQIC